MQLRKERKDSDLCFGYCQGETGLRGQSHPAVCICTCIDVDTVEIGGEDGLSGTGRGTEAEEESQWAARVAGLPFLGVLCAVIRTGGFWLGQDSGENGYTCCA